MNIIEEIKLLKEEENKNLIDNLEDPEDLKDIEEPEYFDSLEHELYVLKKLYVAGLKNITLYHMFKDGFEGNTDYQKKKIKLFKIAPIIFKKITEDIQKTLFNNCIRRIQILNELNNTNSYTILKEYYMDIFFHKMDENLFNKIKWENVEEFNKIKWENVEEFNIIKHL